MFASKYKYENNRLYVSAPHLSYISAVYIQAVFACFNHRMVLVKYINHEAQVLILIIKEIEGFFEERIRLFRDYNHKARFGGRTPEYFSFVCFQKGVKKADSIIKCEDQSGATNNRMGLAKFYNIEGAFVLFDYALITEYYSHQLGGTFLTPDNPKFDYVLTLFINPIYDGFFAPIFTYNREVAQRKEEFRLFDDNCSFYIRSPVRGRCLHSGVEI